MIKFNTPIGDIQLPNNLLDITFETYQFILDNPKDPVEILCKLTDWTPENIKLIDVSPIVPHLDFLTSREFEAVQPSKNISIVGVDFELHSLIQGTWGQKLAAAQHIRKGNVLLTVSIYLSPLYYDRKFNEEEVIEFIEILKTQPAENVISLYKWIKDSVENIIRWEVRNLPYKPSGDEIRAGISDFNRLGDTPTIDRLAGGDVLKWEAVLDLPYSTIRKKLLLSNISSNFEKKLSEIKSKS